MINSVDTYIEFQLFVLRMSKPLDRITLLETFVRIAEAGSISGAARTLGLSQPSASRQLADLEASMGVQLIRRTTHTLNLTEAGSDLLLDARRLLDDWEALAEKHRSADASIRGKLKIIAPVALGQQLLARVACEFQVQHPGVVLNFELSDRPIRFAEEGCDCWIRVGPIVDDSLVVRPLAKVERLVVCAPQLTTRSSKVSTPKLAERLPMVALDPYEGGRIPLTHQKREYLFSPQERMRTNNIFALKEAALAGIGMAVLPKWFVTSELDNGSLVDLMPSWRAPYLPVQVAYLPARHQTLRLRAFLETLGAQLSQIGGLLPIE
ncbi:MAG: LysR family transcriptional regulator [Congregibacter sp.]